MQRSGQIRPRLVVADMGRKDRDDSNSPTHPEAVKPGITSFPALADFKSDEVPWPIKIGCILLLDLLVMFRIQRPSGGLVF